jgi:hypothetical protein
MAESRDSGLVGLFESFKYGRKLHVQSALLQSLGAHLSVCQKLKYEPILSAPGIISYRNIQKQSSEFRIQISRFLDSNKRMSGLDGEHLETKPDIDEMKPDEDSNDVRLHYTP